MIDLGEAEPIDRMIADFRAGLLGEGAEDDRPRHGRSGPARHRHQLPSDAGAALRAALFDTLISALGERTRLLLAPDGDLTRLPFEVLPTGRWPARDRRLRHQLSELRPRRAPLRRRVHRPAHRSPWWPPTPTSISRPRGPRRTPAPVDPNPPRSGASLWSRLFGGADGLGGGTFTHPPSEPAVQPGLPCDRTPVHTISIACQATRAEGERIAELLGVSPG